MKTSPSATRELALAAVLALTLSLSGCGSDESTDSSSEAASSASPSSTSTSTVTVAADALAAYSAAQKTFGTTMATVREDSSTASTLAEQVAIISRVRTAIFDLDAAVRAITMPDAAASAANELLTAAGAAIARFDAQAATTTQEAYQAANTSSTTAYQAFETALSNLGTALSDAAESESKPTTNQQPITADYVVETNGISAVTDAARWRDDLLEIGAKNAVDQSVDGSHLIVTSWNAAFPQILPDGSISGYGQPAPLSGISGFTVFAKDPKELPGSDNPLYLAFAVADRNGTCAGGILTGFPVPNTAESVEIAAGAVCSGETVAIQAGYLEE